MSLHTVGLPITSRIRVYLGYYFPLTLTFRHEGTSRPPRLKDILRQLVTAVLVQQEGMTTRHFEAICNQRLLFKTSKKANIPNYEEFHYFATIFNLHPRLYDSVRRCHVCHARVLMPISCCLVYKP